MFRKLNWSHRDFGKATNPAVWQVMAKNRAWKAISGDCAFLLKYKFPVKILAWNLAGWRKASKYNFAASLGRLPSTDWQKSSLNLKIPAKSVVFAPLVPPPIQVSTFLIITAKEQRCGLHKHFLCGQFISNVYGLSSVAYWMDTT